MTDDTLTITLKYPPIADQKASRWYAARLLVLVSELEMQLGGEGTELVQTDEYTLSLALTVRAIRTDGAKERLAVVADTLERLAVVADTLNAVGIST